MGSTMESDGERVIKAVKAMADFGILSERVTPVLKRLLYLYNNDWTIIEQENYHHLADAIFDSEETKDGKAVIIVDNDAEPPLKKPYRGLSEGRGTSSQSLSGLTDSVQNKPKQRNSSSSRYTHQTTLQTSYTMAKSKCGTVKLSLISTQAAGHHNFLNPNPDAVLGYVENRYRRIYRNYEEPFCMKKLMKGICEAYLEMGTEDVESVRRRALCESQDIANATEKVQILLDNTGGREDFSNFIYIPASIVHDLAYVRVSLASVSDEDSCSSCKGDCLSSVFPCECSVETGGEFAYTSEGRLTHKFLKSILARKQKPGSYMHFCNRNCPLERVRNAYNPEKCKGHVLRKFIKECWRKCRCSMQCSNRVVQRGISAKLQVFFVNEEKGWGLRTLEKLPAGCFICEYAGEILTNTEMYERNERNKNNTSKNKHAYPMLLDADWASESFLKDEHALCLDATYYGNVARFINHRCFDGNLIDVPVQIETSDRHIYHVAFFTNREVEASEELTWDYGIDFDDHDHPIKAFQCSCGSGYCRSTIDEEDSFTD